MYCKNCLKFINEPDTKICPYCGAFPDIDLDAVKKDNRNSFFRNIIISIVIIIPILLIGLWVVSNAYKSQPPEPPVRSTDDLPYAIDYNGTDIYYLGSRPYQTYSNNHYSYSLYLVSVFDISNLSEHQLYWLLDSDMTISAYLVHEKNGIDFDSMTHLGNLHVTDEGLLYVVYVSSFFDDYRYDFIGSEIILHLEIVLEQDYQPELGDDSDVHFEINIDSPITDAESIPQPLYGYVSKWLRELNESYSKMFSAMYD